MNELLTNFAFFLIQKCNKFQDNCLANRLKNISNKYDTSMVQDEDSNWMTDQEYHEDRTKYLTSH